MAEKEKSVEEYAAEHGVLFTEPVVNDFDIKKLSAEQMKTVAHLISSGADPEIFTHLGIAKASEKEDFGEWVMTDTTGSS